MPPIEKEANMAGRSGDFSAVIFVMSIRVMTKTTSTASTTLFKTSQMLLDIFISTNQMICLRFD